MAKDAVWSSDAADLWPRDRDGQGRNGRPSIVRPKLQRKPGLGSSSSGNDNNNNINRRAHSPRNPRRGWIARGAFRSSGNNNNNNNNNKITGEWHPATGPRLATNLYLIRQTKRRDRLRCSTTINDRLRYTNREDRSHSPRVHNNTRALTRSIDNRQMARPRAVAG